MTFHIFFSQVSFMLWLSLPHLLFSSILFTDLDLNPSLSLLLFFSFFFCSNKRRKITPCLHQFDIEILQSSLHQQNKLFASSTWSSVISISLDSSFCVTNFSDSAKVTACFACHCSASTFCFSITGWFFVWFYVGVFVISWISMYHLVWCAKNKNGTNLST